jgi:hypothetical protein
VRGALGLLDPDVTYRGLFVCDPEPCLGTGPVAEVLQLEVADGAVHVLYDEAAEADGAAVVAPGELRARWDPSPEGRVAYTVRCEASVGRITAIRFTPDERDDRTRRLLLELRRVRDALDAARADGSDGPVAFPLP